MFTIEKWGNVGKSEKMSDSMQFRQTTFKLEEAHKWDHWRKRIELNQVFMFPEVINTISTKRIVTLYKKTVIKDMVQEIISPKCKIMPYGDRLCNEICINFNRKSGKCHQNKNDCLCSTEQIIMENKKNSCKEKMLSIISPTQRKVGLGYDFVPRFFFLLFAKYIRSETVKYIPKAEENTIEDLMTSCEEDLFDTEVLAKIVVDMKAFVVKTLKGYDDFVFKYSMYLDFQN